MCWWVGVVGCGWVCRSKRLVCCHRARSVRLLNQQPMRSREGNTRIAPVCATFVSACHTGVDTFHQTPAAPCTGAHTSIRCRRPFLYALTPRSHVNCIRFVLRDDVDDASMGAANDVDVFVKG